MIAAPVQCDVDGIPKGSHCFCSSDSGAFGCQFLPPRQLRVRRIVRMEYPLRERTGGAVCVDEDALGRASRLDQGEAAWRNAVLEQPLSFAEHQRKGPDAIFV